MALTRITKGVIKPNENYDTHDINSTGIITATALNISGNASIGGVLTYEDVTSIDSVGIITAQNGLHVLNGYVGIGTAFPGEALDINSKTNSRAIRVYSEGSSSTSKLVLRTGDSGTSKIHFGDTSDIDVAEIRYQHSNDSMQFYTNTNERVRITSTGDIQVDNGNLHIDDNGEFAIFEQNTSLAMTNSSKISMDFASNVARIRSSHNGSGGNAVSRPLAFFIGSSEKLRIDSSGRVMIGTTTEGFATYGDQFTIANSGHCGMTIRSGTSNYGTIYFSDGDDGSADEVRGFVDYNHSTNMLQLGTNGSARLRITSDGSVRMGDDGTFTADTGADELVVGNANNGVNRGMTIYNHSGSDGRICFAQPDDVDAGMIKYSHGSDVLQFFVESTERVRMHSNGRFELKNTITSSVQSHFEIGDTQGSFDFQMSDSSGGSDFIKHVKKRFVGKNTYGLTISSRSTLASSYTGTGDASIKFYYPSAGGGAQAGSQLEFWTNQNGYAGTSEAKRMQISNSGNIGAPNGNNIYNASDERLKENMVELTNGLDKIKKLKPISFNWKDGWDECMSGKKEYGFGAQTTQVVDEMLVEPFGTEDTLLNGEVITNPLRVNEKYIIPLLVKAIQEQQEQIEILKTEVDTLKSS